MSKSDTVKDLKEKIKRCLKDLLERKLKLNKTENITFKTVKLFSIIYGMKKRKREILRLIYSYNENVKKYNIAGCSISDENQTIDVIYFYSIY